MGVWNYKSNHMEPLIQGDCDWIANPIKLKFIIKHGLRERKQGKKEKTEGDSQRENKTKRTKHSDNTKAALEYQPMVFNQQSKTNN